ncbi:MAG: hypothetical protein PVJ39_15645 [Gammaproteobacteria bacterium]|jgi:hypothetical protein
MESDEQQNGYAIALRNENNQQLAFVSVSVSGENPKSGEYEGDCVFIVVPANEDFAAGIAFEALQKRNFRLVGEHKLKAQNSVEINRVIVFGNDMPNLYIDISNFGSGYWGEILNDQKQQLGTAVLAKKK